MHLEIMGYRLRPFQECYTIERFVPEHVIQRGPNTGQQVEARWESIECYPWTFEKGLTTMLEIIERHASNGEAETVKHAAERWAELQTTIQDALSSHPE